MKYRDWMNSQPTELPDGFVKVSVLLTSTEARSLRQSALLTEEGTYSAAIRSRMNMRETPRGLKQAVARIGENE